MIAINFKICDNAKECYALLKCPTGAISWDDEENDGVGGLLVDQSKCTGCKFCAIACPEAMIEVFREED